MTETKAKPKAKAKAKAKPNPAPEPTREQKNLALWDAVEKTDPDMTKKVGYGARKFTAIDAYYQIKQCTAIFGPLGIGWGYDAAFERVEVPGAIPLICDLKFWWTMPREYDEDLAGEQFQHYVTTSAELWSEKHGWDKDAHKKCLTDALTKAISYLGFNSDVFMGKFDDNGYVNQRKKEVHQEKQDKYEAAQEAINDAEEKVRAKGTKEPDDKNMHADDKDKCRSLWRSMQGILTLPADDKNTYLENKFLVVTGKTYSEANLEEFEQVHRDVKECSEILKAIDKLTPGNSEDERMQYIENMFDIVHRKPSRDCTVEEYQAVFDSFTESDHAGQQGELT